MIKNARLSFPSLFVKSSYKGVQGNNYDATLLVSKKDTETETLLRNEIKTAMKQANLNVKPQNTFFQDGDEKDYNGFNDTWSLKVTNTNRPTTVDRGKNQVTKEDDVFYAGCYVNALIDISAYKDSYGTTRVSARLMVIQFSKDGDVFSGAPVATDADLDAFDED